MHASKNKEAERCVCGARLGSVSARLALARLLSARVIKLLTGLYRGARGNMLLPD